MRDLGVVFALVLTALVACARPDQTQICTRGARARDPGFEVATDGSDSAFFQQCMREHWTEKQLQCVLNAGYGTLAMSFCFGEPAR